MVKVAVSVAARSQAKENRFFTGMILVGDDPKLRPTTESPNLDFVKQAVHFVNETVGLVKG